MSLNIVTISSLYPNAGDFKHGVFVETRLRNLLKTHSDVNAIVIAPVPWFPFKHKIFGEYAKYANVPPHEVRHGIHIYHPKYLVIPKIGMLLTPKLMARGIKKQLQAIIQSGFQIDLIDGHYFYPDGVAIAKAASELNIPFTCTARGTDINLIPKMEKPRALIQQVFGQAAHLMAVCSALKDEMQRLGAAEEKTTVLRNGVDLKLFKPSTEMQQAQLKQQLKQQLEQQLKQQLIGDKKLLLSVGWLIERKGHYLVIEAMRSLENCHLMIAGDGPDKKALEKQVDKLNLKDKVTFLGALPQSALADYYRAADALVLASSREGWANVLLEAMACGTPVVAANIWGTPEVVAAEEAGVLVDREAKSIAQGIEKVLQKSYTRADTRAYAEQFSWLETSNRQYQIFSAIKQSKSES
ncbi:glycosyltransferase family 4 protein [Catenovulum sediminis]|uniref:glycosyltransferase family 4 protein n=1 Tax=Catenovulum sediminis TaxID=1740262 RepID=UPI001FE92E9D|nr:glycosyltransferase family 4 protein [Catenovulum sediminis]